MFKTSEELEMTAMPHLEKVEVEIIASPGSGGKIVWSHKVKSTGHSNGNKINLPNGVGYRIHFDLDRNGLDVRFDAKAPFFCKDGTSDPCPSSITSKQVMVDECDADDLYVIDWNYGDPMELRYQLNFVTEVGDPVDAYDPIIENGGGGIKPNNA